MSIIGVMDKKLKIVNNLLQNMLGHNPDKFGLVLNDGGWTSLKSLHHGLLHEADFSWVTPGLLRQFFTIVGNECFERNEKFVRLRPEFQSSEIPCMKRELPPRILYTAIRPRAYHAVREKGLLAADGQWLLLSPDMEEAKSIGKKKDNEPIIITVMASQAEQAGSVFFRYGKSLYLSRNVGAQWLILPPQNKKIRHLEKTGAEKIAHKKEKAPVHEHSGVGSFFLEPPLSGSRNTGNRKGEPAWKEVRRRTRRR